MDQGYYMNPNVVARRISRIIAHFDGAVNVQNLNLNTQWHELGTLIFIFRTKLIGFCIIDIVG